MIQYALKCADGHIFDSWFQSAEAFEKLSGAGHVACAVCGSGEVSKSVMAPAVRGATKERARLDVPRDDRERALTELRRKVTENSDYVGMNFATEARAIHDGTAPERPIYGEARADEARKLIEDGVPVSPLPFIPARKAN